jgi:hypothetical protein
VVEVAVVVHSMVELLVMVELVVEELVVRLLPRLVQ